MSGEADVLAGTQGQAQTPDERRIELVGEGFTMALYVGLLLLAVMVALSPSRLQGDSIRAPALAILATSVGLILAHQIAFRIFSRLIGRRKVTRASSELLAAQLVGGLAVAAVAVLPVLVFGSMGGVAVSEFLLLALICLVAYRAARVVPVGRVTALMYVAVIVLLPSACSGSRASPLTENLEEP
jgi:hypothetical protein